MKFSFKESADGRLESGYSFIAKYEIQPGVIPGEIYHIDGVDHGFCYAIRVSKKTGLLIENILKSGNHLWFESDEFNQWLSEGKIVYCNTTKTKTA
jgi:hypothetical protein